jgi:SAM-dependent methyltransferase
VARVTSRAERAQRARSFGEVAEDYDRLRPSPPDAAVDWLLPDRCEVAVDLAAGTGLLSRALARRVPRVVAVEPDDRMAAVLGPRSPRVRVVRAVGEAIPVAGARADGVFIQSAWHWLDPDRAIPEIARVLRPGGCFGAVWITRDPGRGLGGGAGPYPAAARSGADQSRGAPGRPARATPHAGPADWAAEHERARAYLARRFPGADRLEVPLHAWCWRARRSGRPTPV